MEEIEQLNSHKLRILWHSNAPWASTGYGNQTKLFTPRIRALGYEVSISGFWGLQAGVIRANEMTVLPNGYHPYGIDIIGAHAANVKADIVITLLDAWVIDPSRFPNVKWVPWFPVDSYPLPASIFHQVNQAYDRIVFSRFAEEQVHNAGLSCRYIPHGTDTKVYHPININDAREKMNFPKDAFIVGMVAANKGAIQNRKAFDPQIRAFSELYRKHSDCILYLHTLANQQGQIGDALNLAAICEFYGLTIGKNVWFVDEYFYHLGLPDNPYMLNAYNSMDVLLNVSMGEGFGIPILEAQACGTPVIVGNWTSMSELCFSGWKVDQSESDEWMTPLISYQRMPRWQAVHERLESAYNMRGNQDYRSLARDGALSYDVDKITEKYWKPTLDIIQKNLDLL